MTKPNASPLTPPHDFDAEEGLLGTLLNSAAAIGEARGIVSADDFYKPSHAHIFAAICALDDRSEPADPVTIVAELKRLGLADGITGADLLGFAANAPASNAVGTYARIVAELARKRRLAGAGQRIAEAALDPTRTAESVAEEGEARIVIAAGQSERQRATLSAAEAIGLVIEQAAAIEDLGGTGLAGLPTGFADVDLTLGGLEDGSFAVVGARPSMGKTAFGLGIAAFNAFAGTPTLLVSAEMSSIEIGRRFVSMLGNVSSDRQRSGRMTADEWSRVLAVQDRFSSAPIEIVDEASPSLNTVRLRARAMKARQGLGLVVIDYLQLIAGPKAERRELEVSGTARGLKALARDLGCVVVALAQLNRGLESRADKRPMLADLRESGAIEQDADVVMFLYRDELYNPASPDRGIAEVSIAKHRSGPTGMARLLWVPELARFANLDSVHVP